MICLIKTRNSVNVIKSNFHTFPIRYNSEIEANNNTIFIKCLYQIGVKTVGDLGAIKGECTFFALFYFNYILKEKEKYI